VFEDYESIAEVWETISATEAKAVGRASNRVPWAVSTMNRIAWIRF